MSYTAQDWRVAVTNLLKMTSKGEIDWTLSELFAGDAWTEVDRSFQARLDDKLFVVSQTRYRHYLDEDEYVWSGGYDFSVFSTDFEPKRLASAPRELSIIRSLFNEAENAFAYRSNALGGLL